jgi:peptide-methionine (R)-S-oxide reductase
MAMARALLLLLLGFVTGCRLESTSRMNPTNNNEPSRAAAGPQAGPVTKSEEEWRKELSSEQFHVLREAGTERPFGQAYEEFKKQGGGTYVCGGCGAELFSSKEKFDSHCGWPSFYDPANATNVVTREDYNLGMKRTEVLCARCGGHLGHVFTGEGYATPTDKRYCINAVSLKFVPAGNAAKP